MNIKKLKDAEKTFFKKYPGGFEHPTILEIGKKHRIKKLTAKKKKVFKKNK